MADKAISELVEASSITPTDLLVMEQNNTAKKITGQTLINFLTAIADGHGGIQSIAKVSASGLVDTYRITLADLTTFDFQVTNGRSITSVSQTSVSGLSRTYTIAFNDNTEQTFVIRDGAKGDTGQTWYIWIKYASQEPTEDSHSIGNLPDDWMGVYSGTLEEAPDDWTMYSWFRIKGETGETGAPAVLNSSVTDYQSSDSGTIIPSGAWTTTIPNVAQGKYLWTRTTNIFNTGAPVVSYSVSRMGLDGSGSVSSVANISPDANGNVPLTAENIGALPSEGGIMSGPINMNGQSLTGLNPPTSESDAVNRGYSDNQITDRVIQSGGKNLMDTNTLTPKPSKLNVEFSNGKVRLYSTEASAWLFAVSSPYVLKAGMTYTMSATVDAYVSGSISFGFYGVADTKFKARLADTTKTGRHSVRYTPTEDIEAVFAVAVTTNDSAIGDATFSDIMVEEGSSATDFEPYYLGLAELTQIVNALLEG